MTTLCAGLYACPCSFHTTVFLDFSTSPSGTPYLWRYSLGKIGLMGIYLTFLVAHVGAIKWAPPRILRSNPFFGLAICLILYGGTECLLRLYGFGLITPTKIYKGEGWNADIPNRTWRYVGGRLFTPQEFSTLITNNSQGFHDRDHRCGKNDTTQILLMDDSYVEAYQVPLGDALHTVLQTELTRLTDRPIEVIAIGQSGTGLDWQINQKLESCLRCYMPDIVVSQYAPWFATMI